jgi:hypothetical protein
MDPVNPVGRVEEARVGERSKHACDTREPNGRERGAGQEEKDARAHEVERSQSPHGGLAFRLAGHIGRLVILTSEFFGAPYQWVTDQGVDDEW